jgi:hypothetical protein
LLPFATRAFGVHNAPGFHTRLRSAHSVSHTLDGLLLQIPRGLVSSHSHVRDSLFRGFSRCQAGLVSSTSRTLMPLATFTYQRVAPLAPAPATPTTECSSEQRSVAANRRFRPAYHSIPSWAFNSCGLFSEHLGDALTPPPPVTFPASHSLYERQPAFDVSIDAQPDDLSPDPLPVRASWPSLRTAEAMRKN